MSTLTLNSPARKDTLAKGSKPSIKSREYSHEAARTTKAVSAPLINNPLAGKSNVVKFARAVDASNSTRNVPKEGKQVTEMPPKPINTSQASSLLNDVTSPSPVPSASSQPAILPTQALNKPKSSSVHTIRNGRSKLASNPIVVRKDVGGPNRSTYESTTPVASTIHPSSVYFETQPLSDSKKISEEKPQSVENIIPEVSTRKISVRDKAALFAGHAVSVSHPKSSKSKADAKTKDVPSLSTLGYHEVAVASVQVPKNEKLSIASTGSTRDQLQSLESQLSVTTTISSSTGIELESTFSINVSSPVRSAKVRAVDFLNDSSLESAEKHLITLLERTNGLSGTPKFSKPSWRRRTTHWHILALIMFYVFLILLSIYANDSKAFADRYMKQLNFPEAPVHLTVKEVVLSNIGSEFFAVNDIYPFEKFRLSQALDFVKLCWSKLTHISGNIMTFNIPQISAETMEIMMLS